MHPRNGEKEFFEGGGTRIPASIAAVIKQRKAASPIPEPAKVPRAPVQRAPRRPTAKQAQAAYQSAVSKFAKNWSHFSAENPDTQPEDAAHDAAAGFFYEHPEWREWSQALDLTRQDIQSNVADYVHDAMTKGKKSGVACV